MVRIHFFMGSLIPPTSVIISLFNIPVIGFKIILQMKYNTQDCMQNFHISHNKITLKFRAGIF